MRARIRRLPTTRRPNRRRSSTRSMAFRAFEAWYEAERGEAFLQVFERYMPPTPLVEF